MPNGSKTTTSGPKRSELSALESNRTGSSNRLQRKAESSNSSLNELQGGPKSSKMQMAIAKKALTALT